MIFEKIECLVNTYKSDGLSDKLPKRNIYIYIYKEVYFILSVNFVLLIIIIIIIISSC